MNDAKKLTGLTDYQYNEIVFNTGIAYLTHECCNNQACVSMLAVTMEYWNFWQRIVQSRTELFLEQFADSLLSKKELQYIFEALLNVQSLSIYPPKFDWADAYHQYISHYVKNQKQISHV